MGSTSSVPSCPVCRTKPCLANPTGSPKYQAACSPEHIRIINAAPPCSICRAKCSPRGLTGYHPGCTVAHSWQVRMQAGHPPCPLCGRPRHPCRDRRQGEFYAGCNPEHSDMIKRGVKPAGGSANTVKITPELANALKEVEVTLTAAFVGIGTDKLTVDAAITLVAVSVAGALRTCPIQSQQDLQNYAMLVTAWMDDVIESRIPSMEAEMRKQFILKIWARVADLLQGAKAQRIEESLMLLQEAMKQAMEGYASGSLSRDDAVKLLGVAVAAGLKNCNVSTKEELARHLAGFTAFMLELVDRMAPSLRPDAKKQFVVDIWDTALTLLSRS
eukprot:TRINITY_DN486_c0_g2_i2.p1 TRINITY_DN486_c0_g2~~TRINITY_DN486_c0_g2_i2.p1  ORF type:complete len:330 (+),score=75.11 TRINITY_DN486_c0_g2_i2:139-1128(+)